MNVATKPFKITYVAVLYFFFTCECVQRKGVKINYSDINCLVVFIVTINTVSHPILYYISIGLRGFRIILGKQGIKNFH